MAWYGWGSPVGLAILLVGAGVAAVLIRFAVLGSLAAFARQHVAEQLPRLAVEARQLDRLDRIEVGRAGVDLDAGQQDRHHEVFMLAACFIRLARVSVSPHSVSTWRIVADTE